MLYNPKQFWVQVLSKHLWKASMKQMLYTTSEDTSHKAVTPATHPSIFPSLKHRRKLELLFVPPAELPGTQVIVLMPAQESRMNSLGHSFGSLSPNKNYKHRCGSLQSVLPRSPLQASLGPIQHPPHEAREKRWKIPLH